MVKKTQLPAGNSGSGTSYVTTYIQASELITA